MTYWDKEKSLAMSEPYELHLFWKGDYRFPYYPALRTTSDQADPGLIHTTPISDVNDLQDMKNDLSGNYYLTNDIDASATSSWNGGQGFEPIGTFFTGTLDGCGYTISNLYIDRVAGFVGLFNTLRPPAKVANLTLSNINYTSTAYIGGLASDIHINAATDVLVQNVHVTGTIQGDSSSLGLQYCGGLVGRAYLSSSTGTIYFYDSSANVTIDQTYSDDNYRGGFVGRASDCVEFKNCYAAGSLTNAINETRRWIGGFAGSLEDVVCSYCYATGDVTGSNGYWSIGGFAGTITDSGSSITKCYATGDVEGYEHVGGFVGGVEVSVTISDCYAIGDVTAHRTDTAGVGGFCGNNAGLVSSFDNIYSVGAVIGGTEPGGLIGNKVIGTTVTSSYWDTETSGQSTSDGGTGKTTRQMYDRSTYDGWDFNTIWVMTSLVENDDAWAYADAPQDVDYNGLTFRAVYIKGEKIEEGTTRIKSRTKVKTNWNLNFPWQYTIQPPSAKIHYRRFRGQGGDIKLMYAGEVLQVEFKQSSRQGNRYAEILIEPPRADLGEYGLISRYSRQCTVELYSSQCGANPGLYETTGILDSLSDNVLTSTTFGGQTDGYWNGGQIIIGDLRAKIVEHSGDDITILPYLYEIKAGDTFTIYPGCDHLSATCNSKFNNLANFKGQPNIPIQSPFDNGSIYK